MNTANQWTLDLVDALSFEEQFTAAQLVLPSFDEAKLVQPTLLQSAYAVANIRAWRSYLPQACVFRMVEEGWQWST